MAQLLGWLLRLPGHATCRHLGRYRSDHERTFARWYARDVDVVSLHKTAIPRVMSPEPAQAWVSDARVVANSGQKTDGLDRCWNGRHRRPETGLEISALAWLAMTDRGADGLSVAQTPPTDQTTAPEATRLAVYLDQWTRVGVAQHLHPLRDVITDGYDSPQHFTRGIRDLGVPQMGTRRIDATRRARSQGPQRPGRGRPHTYEGKGNGDDRTRVETGESEDDPLVLSQHVLNQVPCPCHLRVVRGGDTPHSRRARRLRTDVHLDALPLDRSDQARFPSECLCRDAKQLPGLTAGQARSQAHLHVHGTARLSAVPRAKLEAHHQHGAAA